MKTRLILFLLCGIALFGCSRYRGFGRELDRAEALMQEHPDSAYGMLYAMNGRAGEMYTSLRMRHLLLLCNAQNKADVPFASDSAGTVLAKYYERHGTPNERMLAHYMKGCAYRDMGEWPSAVACFNNAVAAADTAAADCNFRQLSIIYGQLAQIHKGRYLTGEAIQAYKKAEKYVQDSLSMLIIREHLARALIDKGDLIKGTTIIEDVTNRMLAMGYTQNAARAISVCITPYTRLKMFEQAKVAMEKYETLSGVFFPNGEIEPGREDYYYTKGTFYEEKENFDSAEYYYRKLKQLSNTLNSQYLASWGLTRLYRTNGKKDSLAKYALRTFLMGDSLYNSKVAQNIQLAQSMYDYSRHQEEAKKQIQETQKAELRLRNFITVATLIVFVIILLALLYRNRVCQKMHDIHLEQVRDSAVVETLTKEVEEKTSLISLLHEQMNENAVDLQESEQMRRAISILEQQIQEYKQQIDTFTKSQHASHLREEPAIAQFIHMAKEGKRKPNKEEWQRIIVLVETYHPGMKEIKNRKDVSPQEYRICVLLKLGLRVSDIVFIEETSNSNLTNIRSRLLRKLFGIEGGAKDFDRRLSEI